MVSDDQNCMKRAIALAARGRGRVEPNPMVGCVIVHSGRVIAEGYHHYYGGPHAEIDALRNAGKTARGSTAYVTLEPCCHFGKTPPCSRALIEAGVSRVVVSVRDPFPKVRGKGFQELRRAGIEVETGVMEREGRRLIAPYLKMQEVRRPWVILKWAQSLDGKIATRTGDSQWISGETSRKRAHAIRARVDAIIVGVGTVVADDPELTTRHVKPKRVATRIVLDPSLRAPVDSTLVRTARETPTIIVTASSTRKGAKADRLRDKGVELLPVPARSGSLALGKLLDKLGRRGMTNIMVEGGGRTLGAFYDAGLADEAVIFVARRLIGGYGGIDPLSGRGPARMDGLRDPIEVDHQRCGDDDMYRVLFTEW